MKKIICLFVGLMFFVGCNSSLDNQAKTLLDKRLEEAIDLGEVQQVKDLLAQGGNPNLKEKDGTPKLVSLAMVHLDADDEEIFKLLLGAGADPNIADKDGDTALMASSRKGDLVFMKLLLEAGADPNLCDKEGYGALMDAAEKGYDEAVKLLLSHGANPNLQNDWKTPLYLAILGNRASTVRILLEAGANPNLEVHEGGSLLQTARIKNSSEIEAMLLEAGAK